MDGRQKVGDFFFGFVRHGCPDDVRQVIKRFEFRGPAEFLHGDQIAVGFEALEHRRDLRIQKQGLGHLNGGVVGGQGIGHVVHDPHFVEIQHDFAALLKDLLKTHIGRWPQR